MPRRTPTLDPPLWLLLVAALGAALGVVLPSPQDTLASLVALLCCTVALVALWRKARPEISRRPQAAAPTKPPPAADSALRQALQLVAAATQSDAAQLLGPGAAPGQLRLRASWPEPLTEHLDFPCQAGLPGAALSAGAPVSAAPGAEGRLLPYRSAGTPPAGALALPVPAEPGPWVLVVERSAAPPFAPSEESAARAGAELLARIVEAGVAFDQAARRERALSWTVDTAHELAAANELADVARACVAAARRLVPVDVAVLSLWDEERNDHAVLIAEGAAIPEGARFEDGPGLVAQSARRGVVLPAEGRYHAGHGLPFGASLAFAPPEDSAFAIVPLEAGRRPVGTLLVATARLERYEHDARVALHSVGELAGAELERRRLERSLSELARTDALTGLPNRRAFEEGLAAALLRSERYGHPATLLMMDVDHFKRVNDSHGHPTGDVVLRQLGRLIRELAREVDVPGRLGGEEFALLLEHTSPEAGLVVAERIRNALSRIPFEGAEGSFRVTLSLGLAGCPQHAREASALLRIADEALYEAKSQGRDRCRIAHM